ncbi:MAG: hypothetical protein V1738_00685 [Patescibacteria group bacterium]
MTPLSPFHLLFKRTVGRYAERFLFFLILGALTGIVPSAIVLLGLFPAMLGTEPGQLDLISSNLIRIIALLLSFVLLAPLQISLAFAATGRLTNPLAFKNGLIHSHEWLGTSLLTSLALIVPAVLIAPGAFLGTRLAFVLPVIVSEKKTGFSALRRSNDLVRGRSFQIFIFLLGFGIFSAAISLPLWLIPTSWLGNLASFTVSSLVVVPLFIIFLQVLYEDLCRASPAQKGPPETYFFHKVLVGLGSIIFLLTLFKAAF